MNYHPPTGQASGRLIAIVGMACRFPKAPDPRALWRLLVAGDHALREVPDDRWRAADFVDPNRRAPAKMVTARGGFLDRVDGFDAPFFGISAREAVQIDPQQRLALELAWEALESAGIAPNALRESDTGVFMGAMWTDYARLHSLAGIEQHSGTGWHLGVVPGRVSYALGLRGPSMAINTACSSSLVAVHLAVKALLDRETSLALAGGVSLMLAPHVAVAMSKFGGTSASGRCYAYDARADGYVRGEGGGVVALRRYEDARAANERIIAVIRASAVNNDGGGVGLTVPTEAAQRSLLRDVYARAAVDPREVFFVEGHGTGTPVGDPIEARALGAELGSPTRETPLWLGSIKPNIGHTEAASGVASLIKTALALDAGLIPPNRNFEQPNPSIDFEGLGLRVPVQARAWTGPRLAGVNSFGFGGTNCHIVLSAPPRSKRAAPAAVAAPARTDHARLIVASARDPAALEARLGQLREFAAEALQSGSQAASQTLLDNLAHTQWHGRSHLEHRAFVGASSLAQLLERLDAGEAQSLSLRRSDARPKLVFAFSGQGSQWVDMGRELRARMPAFRSALQTCSAIMTPMIGWSISEAIETRTLAPQLEYVDGIQPAIYAIQVALAETWASLGIRPDAVIGHSMGEVAAAVAAGAISREDGALITCERARLLRRISGRGGMLSLNLSAPEVERLLHEGGKRYAGLGVAVDGGAGSTVVSGGLEALARLRADLEAPERQDQGQAEVEVRDVAVDVAAHSPQIDALADELLASIHTVRSKPTSVRMLSSVRAEAVDHRDLTPAYWVQNLRQPVRFAAAAARLFDEGHSLFVELSPHPLLTWPLRQMAKARGLDHACMLACMRRARSDQAQFFDAIGALHLRGFEPTLEQAGERLELPAYPWQRRRFWPRAPATPDSKGTASSAQVEVAVEFESERLPALMAHRVDGQATVSAGLALELFARALAVVEPGASLQVEALEFVAPLPGDKRIRLELERGVIELSDGAGPASIRAKVLPLAAAPPLDSPRPDRLTEQRSASQHYARLREEGIVYAEALRAVESAALGPGVARLSLSPQPSRAAVLDACFQAALAAIESQARERGLGTRFVVARVAAATLELDRLHTVTAIHARIRALVEHGCEAEIWLLDHDGQTLGCMRGVELRARPRPAGILHHRVWRPLERPALRAKALGELLFTTARTTPHHPREQALVRGLAESSQRVPFSLSVTAPDQLAAALDDGPSTLVVSAIDPPDADPGAAITATCTGVVAILRSCAALPKARRPRIVILTERAHSIGGEPSLSPGASAIHGLVRVALVELPELRIQLLDLGDVEDPAQLSALVDELAQTSATASLALRRAPQPDPKPQPDPDPDRDPAQNPACLRLSPTLEAIPLPETTWTPRAGSVIVTGALGGIGRAVVRGLAERGTERLLLIGRRALDEERESFIRELGHSSGAELRYIAVDIADAEALGSALADELEHVIGVIHAAAALSNAPLLDHHHQHFDTALRPKLAGAWNLHRLTAALALDFFVLFGSLGGWIGLPGQASYAAANAGLDGLAHYRRGLGLPALSVGWCGWVGLGFARSTGGSASLERLASEGIASLEPAAALELCEHMLATPTLPAVLAVMPPLTAPSEVGVRERAELRLELERLPAAQRQALVTQRILHESAVVLREEPTRVDPQRALRDLGLDSLMSVELAERLARTLGIEASTTLLWKYPTVEALVGHVLTLLEPPPGTPTPPDPLVSGPSTPDLEALADELADLSDEEVEALTRVL